ncbi:hypothetical protein F4801DRAFT_579538 [Xylaria longipes]|nr:hypothetical protein F4801DRAFT_579538 [Xylaria longipes]
MRTSIGENVPLVGGSPSYFDNLKDYLPQPPVLYFAEPNGERKYPYKHHSDGTTDFNESRPVFAKLTVDTPLIRPSRWTDDADPGGSSHGCENAERADPLFLRLSNPHDLAEFVTHRGGPLMELIGHLHSKWEECYGNSQLMGMRQSWGFDEEPSCTGRYVFAAVYFVAHLAQIYACKNLECERRRQALDAAAPACGWPAFRTVVVAVLSCWMPNFVYILQEVIGFASIDSDRFVCLDMDRMVDVCRWGARVTYGATFNEQARTKQGPRAQPPGDGSLVGHGPQQSAYTPTSWRMSTENPSVCGYGEKYMAISHVWSDGTGAGMKSPGQVNRCLLEYFLDLAKGEGCDGLWWDTISIPTEKEARRMAINCMLKNYEEATVTLVHDQEGWTAAKLFASRNHAIKVVFKNPDPAGPSLVKDLDHDILAWDPKSIDANLLADSTAVEGVGLYRAKHMLDDANKVPKLGHFIATDIIRRLRAGAGLESIPDAVIPGRSLVSSIRDLIMILRSRTTSWVRDRLIIPGLMCLPSLDSNSTGPEITRQLLLRFGAVFISDLFHGEVPITSHGPWSWCPPSVFDFGVSRSSVPRHRSGLSYVDRSGVIRGEFSAFSLTDNDFVIPQSSHPATVSRISNALLNRKKCLLLTSDDQSHLSCEWIGCVYLGSTRHLGDTSDPPHWGFQKSPSQFRVRDQSLLNSNRLIFLFGHDLDGNGRPMPAMTPQHLFYTVLDMDRGRLGPLHNRQWILTTGRGSREESDARDVLNDSERPEYLTCTVQLDPWVDIEENFISAALVDAVNIQAAVYVRQNRQPCESNHELSGECHGTVELPWSFPIVSPGQLPSSAIYFTLDFTFCKKTMHCSS